MPLLLLGFDSFDTPFSGCTTHFTALVALLLESRGFRLVDYPWLVRLNPSVPWKTRGNGATALILEVSGEAEAREAVRLVVEAARGYPGWSEGKAALVALYSPHCSELSCVPDAVPTCTRSLYGKAVSSQVSLWEAKTCLEDAEPLINAGGRGIIGALAALGARMELDYTFELVVYRMPEARGPRRLSEESVVEYDLRWRPYTIMNVDYESGRVLVAPHGPDPVLAGFRAEYPWVAAAALREVEFEEPIHVHALFRSNQHTGEHIQSKPVGSVRPYDCVAVEGWVEWAKVLPGGHTVMLICDSTGCIHAACYRESGLSSICADLSGRKVLIRGCAKPRSAGLTVNVEGLCFSYAEQIERILRCPRCGCPLESAGGGGLARCKCCGTLLADLPRVVVRTLSYGVSCVSARAAALHHLAEPPLGRATRKPRGLRWSPGEAKVEPIALHS